MWHRKESREEKRRNRKDKRNGRWEWTQKEGRCGRRKKVGGKGKEERRKADKRGREESLRVRRDENVKMRSRGGNSRDGRWWHFVTWPQRSIHSILTALVFQASCCVQPSLRKTGLYKAVDAKDIHRDLSRTDHNSTVMALCYVLLRIYLVQETRILALCLSVLMQNHTFDKPWNVSYTPDDSSARNHSSVVVLCTHSFPVKPNDGMLKDRIELDVCLPGCMLFRVLLSYILFSSLWIPNLKQLSVILIEAWF